MNNIKICVGAEIVWKNKYLLLYKPKKKLWEFAGGKLEGGETVSEALEREIFEETGLTVTAGPLRGLYSNTNKLNSMIYLKFRIELDFKNEPRIRLSKEHSDHKWCILSEILKLDVSPLLFSAYNEYSNAKRNLRY